MYFHLNINGKLTTNAIPHQRFCATTVIHVKPQNVLILSNHEKVASKERNQKDQISTARLKKKH